MFMSSDWNIVPAHCNYYHKQALSLFNISILDHKSVTWHLDGLCELLPRFHYVLSDIEQSLVLQRLQRAIYVLQAVFVYSTFLFKCRWTKIGDTVVQGFVDSTLHVMFVWSVTAQSLEIYLNDIVNLILKKKTYNLYPFIMLSVPSL